MRKTLAAVLVVGLLWIGYIAWPIYDLLILLHAIENRDAETVTRHVYFDAVRISLTNQVVAGMRFEPKRLSEPQAHVTAHPLLYS